MPLQPAKPYPPEPEDGRAFTRRFDRLYGRFAGLYDLFVKGLPVWKKWLVQAIPQLAGPRILEVSFGTGWLMTRYAHRFEVYGVDMNRRMAAVTRRNLRAAGVSASLQRSDVAWLPFRDGVFDTVLCTMAFSGYPDAQAALSEMLRVLRPAGRLVLIDVNYPADGNRLGTLLTRLWIGLGDLVRDMDALCRRHALVCSDAEIGGWGSVHLYVASAAAAGVGRPDPMRGGT